MYSAKGGPYRRKREAMLNRIDRLGCRKCSQLHRELRENRS